MLDTARDEATVEALLARIRLGLAGEGAVIDGPYGPRRITYADYTASGRSLDLIEDAIRDHVLPVYANTHTESSATGLATSHLREDARQIIHEAVGGTGEHVVIFTGSGGTGAIHKLAAILGLGPLDGGIRLGVAGGRGPVPPGQRPVVFIGPYEHHSNELPWRESMADVVVVRTDGDGRIDMGDLAGKLAAHADRPLRVGSFSAASNVTGILSDTDAIAAVLHAHGALSFWDYAAAGPYLPIQMGESAPGAGDGKDAIFLSPHKFVGGPQTPGVLVVRRDLVRNRVPTVPGGGTIAFVDSVSQDYLDDPVAREEGGTPAIVESIRAGLVFALKQTVGTDVIHAREQRLWRRALRHWTANPHLEILGNIDVPRLPIVSFRVRHNGRYLHHNFIVALLSDLFGIQARGGCSCAGPYGHELLAIDPAESRALRDEVGRGRHGIKPGWARVNFNYFLTDATADFVIGAVDVIASYGHRLLTDYRFEPDTGLWRHHSGLPRAPLRLRDLRFRPDGGGIDAPARRPQVGEEVLAGYLDQARLRMSQGSDRVDSGPTGLPHDFEELRRFSLPPVCLSLPPPR